LSNPALREVVEGAKKGKSTIGELLEQQKVEKQIELENITMERMIAQEKRKLDETKSEGTGEEPKGTPARVEGTDVMAGVLRIAQVDPGKAKEFLDSLDEASIMKLNLLAAGGSSNISALATALKSPGMSAKDVVEIVKLVQPAAPAESAKITIDVAKLFESAIASKTAAPAVDVKAVVESVVKPLSDQVKSLADADRLRMEREIQELKNRPSAVGELTAQAAELGALRSALGIGASAGPSVNVELERERLGLEKFKIEETFKHEHWRDEQGLARRSESEKLKLVRDTLKSALDRAEPIISAAVEEGKRRISTSGEAGAATATVGAGESGFFCSNCMKGGVRTMIPTSGTPASVTCPVCHMTFDRQG